MLLRSALAFVTVSALILGGPGSARADEEVTRLQAKDGKAQRYALKTIDPPNRIETGGAAILVDAPIAQVRQIVTDYRNYSKFIKPFDQSKLISRKDGVSEVYLSVPVMHGAAKVWAVVKAGPPVKDGDGEKIAIRYEKGNVNDFRAVWRLRSVGDNRTIVKLEILVDPKLPLPASMITPELKYAADKGVTAVRDRSEGATKPRTAAAPASKPANVAKR